MTNVKNPSPDAAARADQLLADAGYGPRGITRCGECCGVGHYDDHPWPSKRTPCGACDGTGEDAVAYRWQNLRGSVARMTTRDEAPEADLDSHVEALDRLILIARGEAA